jgi:hypothetical protein
MRESRDRAEWRKSTYSVGGDNCVEVATHLPGTVALRDSKNPTGPTLTVGPADWSAFVARIKAGDL